jgi:MtN3 and saliva related transmembrane protein
VEASDVLGPLASSMGVVMSLAPLFQVRRVLERRSSDDVSIAFPVVIAIGAAAWCAYGVADADVYLIVPNVVGVITNTATVLVVHRYRRSPSTA